MLPAWASSYAGRRSHDQPRNEDDESSLDSEARRRLSSEATPRPTPAPHPQHLASVLSHDHHHNLLGSSSTTDVSSHSRRLGFFTDKLSNSQPLHATGSGQRSGHSLVPALLHPHSHSRGDSALTITSTTPSSTNMTSLSSAPNLSKPHTSPSKVSSRSSHPSVPALFHSYHGCISVLLTRL
jgi:hypothetical protein